MWKYILPWPQGWSSTRQRVQVSVYCFLKKKFCVAHRKELPLTYTKHASICPRAWTRMELSRGNQGSAECEKWAFCLDQGQNMQGCLMYMSGRKKKEKCFCCWWVNQLVDYRQRQDKITQTLTVVNIKYAITFIFSTVCCFNGDLCSTLPLMPPVVLIITTLEKKKHTHTHTHKKKKNIKPIERKEVMRLVSEPFLPPSLPPYALTTTSVFSLLPPSPYSLQCKQRLCHLHTCPAPGAAGRETVHPHSSCTVQGPLPVLILGPECDFTTLLRLQDFSWHMNTTEQSAVH